MKDRLRILIIEDDPYISDFLAMSLDKAGYAVRVAENAAAGLACFSAQLPELLLLDLGLPDRDGLELIRELRERSELPILVISARGQEQDKIEALDLGANDYITKPFQMGELLARIRVAERMLNKAQHPSSEEVWECEWLKLDFARRRVFVDGVEVHLTPIEYKLLCLLVENRGKVLTQNFILREVWGYESGDTKSVRVFMASLRRKIERDSAKPRFLLTRVGVGYLFAEE